MAATKYNRSEIMKQAWTMFRCKIYHYESFGAALKAAWRYAKDNAERLARIEAQKAEQAAKAAAMLVAKPETKRDRFYKKFDREISRACRNVRFGRNDWAVDYRRY